jgi:hypothetical protein
MEAVHSSETMVHFYKTAWNHITEDIIGDCNECFSVHFHSLIENIPTNAQFFIYLA